MSIVLMFVAAALFVILDLVWFYFAGAFFRSEINAIARLTESGGWNLRYLPAALVYVLMSVGLVTFVYPLSTSALSSVLYGALFGLVLYGLYDLTNLATLTDWTWRLSVLDILWGTFLCGTVSAAVYLCARAWF